MLALYHTAPQHVPLKLPVRTDWAFPQRGTTVVAGFSASSVWAAMEIEISRLFWFSKCFPNSLAYELHANIVPGLLSASSLLLGTL
jgi:hypothetical protein